MLSFLLQWLIHTLVATAGDSIYEFKSSLCNSFEDQALIDLMDFLQTFSMLFFEIDCILI